MRIAFGGENGCFFFCELSNIFLKSLSTAVPVGIFFECVIPYHMYYFYLPVYSYEVYMRQVLNYVFRFSKRLFYSKFRTVNEINVCEF